MAAGAPEDGPEPVWKAADRQGANDAWGAFGTIAGGVLVWGGAGWLLDRWSGMSIFTPVGLLLGLGAAFYLVWVRYGKQ